MHLNRVDFYLLNGHRNQKQINYKIIFVLTKLDQIYNLNIFLL